MVQQFQRVRRELTESIVNDRMFAARPGPVGDKPPASPVDAKAEFALCRRQYLAHQRTMEDRVGALRAQVRMAASAASAPLRQLAALDNVLDNALGSHQRRLLANVPHLLETRFKTLTGAARAEVAPQPGSPAADPHAETGGMGRLLQELLLAELEIRLQPIEGMMEALGNKPDGQS